ncbi:ENPP4-like protein [Mya arenaria]|uniref:ENPP4-like protein n=1 Tax=Mya arenaria TaxID=6604 RepID=A0ABY7DLC7_MYAAR|nr:ENPP4-like protein [Mya arenaria]
MKPIFYARGPDIRSGYETRPFNSVDIYPTVCRLLGARPAPNNGTIEHTSDFVTLPVSQAASVRSQTVLTLCIICCMDQERRRQEIYQERIIAVLREDQLRRKMSAAQPLAPCLPVMHLFASLMGRHLCCHPAPSTVHSADKPKSTYNAHEPKSACITLLAIQVNNIRSTSNNYCIPKTNTLHSSKTSMTKEQLSSAHSSRASSWCNPASRMQSSSLYQRPDAYWVDLTSGSISVSSTSAPVNSPNSTKLSSFLTLGTLGSSLKLIRGSPSAVGTACGSDMSAETNMNSSSSFPAIGNSAYLLQTG